MKDKPTVTFSTIPALDENGTGETATTKYEFSEVFSTWSADYSFTFTQKFSEEDKATILGFKSVAALNRFYRRMKRRKEKERRERLKHEARNHES